MTIAERSETSAAGRRAAATPGEGPQLFEFSALRWLRPRTKKIPALSRALAASENESLSRTLVKACTSHFHFSLLTSHFSLLTSHFSLLT
ncbi:hypothetical protein, partial [uncultured Alistipes sp.]